MIINYNATQPIDLQIVMNRCVPKSLLSSNNIAEVTGSVTLGSHASWVSTLTVDLQENGYAIYIYQQLGNAWWIPCLTVVLSVLLSFFWIYLLLVMTRTIIWITITLVGALILAILTFLIFDCIALTSLPDIFISTGIPFIDAVIETQSYLILFLVVFALIFVTFVVSIYYLQRSISITMEMIVETSKIFISMPNIAIFPITEFIALVILATVGGFAYTCTSTLGTIRSSTLSYTIGDKTFQFENGIVFESSWWVWGLKGYVLFWVAFLSYAICRIVQAAVAVSVADWFFTRNKSTVKLSTPNMWLRTVVFYHLGSLLYASLVIEPVRVLNWLDVAFGTSYEKAKKIEGAGEIGERKLTFSDRIAKRITRICKGVNRDLLIHIGIYGGNLCTSTDRNIAVVEASPIKISVITTISSFLMGLIQLLITAIATIVGYFVVINVGLASSAFSNYIPLLGLILTSSFYIATYFVASFSIGVSTVFVCFNEDIESNDGTKANPYYMSNSLRKLMISIIAEQKKKRKRKAKKAQENSSVDVQSIPDRIDTGFMSDSESPNTPSYHPYSRRASGISTALDYYGSRRGSRVTSPTGTGAPTSRVTSPYESDSHSRNFSATGKSRGSAALTSPIQTDNISERGQNRSSKAGGNRQTVLVSPTTEQNERKTSLTGKSRVDGDAFKSLPRKREAIKEDASENELDDTKVSKRHIIAAKVMQTREATDSSVFDEEYQPNSPDIKKKKSKRARKSAVASQKKQANIVRNDIQIESVSSSEHEERYYGSGSPKKAIKARDMKPQKANLHLVSDLLSSDAESPFNDNGSLFDQLDNISNALNDEILPKQTFRAKEEPVNKKKSVKVRQYKKKAVRNDSRRRQKQDNIVRAGQDGVMIANQSGSDSDFLSKFPEEYRATKSASVSRSAAPSNRADFSRISASNGNEEEPSGTPKQQRYNRASRAAKYSRASAMAKRPIDSDGYITTQTDRYDSDEPRPSRVNNARRESPQHIVEPKKDSGNSRAVQTPRSDLNNRPSHSSQDTTGDKNQTRLERPKRASTQRSNHGTPSDVSHLQPTSRHTMNLEYMQKDLERLIASRPNQHKDDSDVSYGEILRSETSTELGHSRHSSTLRETERSEVRRSHTTGNSDFHRVSPYVTSPRRQKTRDKSS